jgi:hypothetical protein
MNRMETRATPHPRARQADCHGSRQLRQLAAWAWSHTRRPATERCRRLVAGGPTTRLIADRFLNWAIKNRLGRSGPTIPKHRRGASRWLGTADQETALTEVVDGGDLSSLDRAAATLILVFGQQIEDVVALTCEDVSVAMIS